MSTEDSAAIKGFMEIFGLTGDPEIDGEDATDDLRVLRQIEKDAESGAEEEFLNRYRKRLIENRQSRSPQITEEIAVLFHTLWTKAVKSERYEKSEWQKLRKMLCARGIEV